MKKNSIRRVYVINDERGYCSRSWNCLLGIVHSHLAGSGIDDFTCLAVLSRGRLLTNVVLMLLIVSSDSTSVRSFCHVLNWWLASVKNVCIW